MAETVCVLDNVFDSMQKKSFVPDYSKRCKCSYCLSKLSNILYVIEEHI